MAPYTSPYVYPTTRLLRDNKPRNPCCCGVYFVCGRVDGVEGRSVTGLGLARFSSVLRAASLHRAFVDGPKRSRLGFSDSDRSSIDSLRGAKGYLAILRSLLQYTASGRGYYSQLLDAIAAHTLDHKRCSRCAARLT